MNISVFGLGYVGAVSAACLADEGHNVVGVDLNPTKVELINSGRATIVEADIDRLTAAGVEAGRLRAVHSSVEAIASSDLSLVCVGTPSLPNGNIDLAQVRSVCQEIGSALAAKAGYHVVVIRSTLLPGSMMSVVVPTLAAASGKSPETDFGICVNPEFLREGTAVFDYRNPPKTVIGEIDRRAGDVLARLYEHLDAALIRTDLRTAEMVKYADNCWHALKVSFANEIGNLSKALDVDGRRVMEIFCEDKKLNISTAYLKPGFAFGGSCLPKDLRALTYKAKSLDIDVPVLDSVLPSNRRQIARAAEMIARLGHRRVGVLGFAFKSGTDDLRESPIVELVEHLIGKGYDLKLLDSHVRLSSLVGANRDYLFNHVPHIARLMVDDVDTILEHAETVVIGNDSPEFHDVPRRLRSDQALVDLVRVKDPSTAAHYDGICW